MRVLITGAAGRVGQAVRRELAAAGHKLRLTDIRPIAHPEGGSLILDVTNARAVLRATRGMDAVVHLAYGSDLNDNSETDIRLNFDVNAKGTYYLLWAAEQQKVKRFVYTSTLSVFGGPAVLARGKLTEKSPPNPRNPYGLTKHFGEQVCEYFATHRGLSVVCLRLCGVVDDVAWQRWNNHKPDRRKDEFYQVHRAIRTHVDDVARAVRLALATPRIRYALLHIAADNKGRVTGIQRAKRVLGFWPRHRLAGK